MKSILNGHNWLVELEKKGTVECIDNDFILMESESSPFLLNYPFKIELFLAIICTQGSIKGKLNLIPFSLQNTGMIIITPGQIQEYEEVSEDFTAKFIMMSRNFLISLNLEEKYPMYNSASNKPCIPLTGEETNALLDYYRIMQQMIQVKENPHRLQAARHLSTAFFYGYYFHKMYVERKKNKHEQLFINFLTLLEQHFREQHGIEFYADKLCLTPKYMSMIIKENSGRTAAEWINNRIILEAKALLYSSPMTIQQISDELHFSSQSSFGKYFKRAMGFSPKEYRRE